MLYDTLFFALGLCRPHGGKNVERLARHIESQFTSKTYRDGVGNVHLDLRGGGSTTLFVAHLDTVHRKDDKNVVDRSKKGWVKAGARNSCLGADDGAGVAMLCHLASSGVPGYYLFTQGEECGGIGARHVALTQSALLCEFDRAIAFDRKDVWSVVTHQGWSGRCCSDAFADALSAALSVGDLIYAPDATGVYTDTAEFVECVPECTNISVGYYDEHGDRECLDLRHFAMLAKAAAAVNWDGLPTKRKPGQDAPWEVESAVNTRREYEFIDAIEAARVGRTRDLSELLAARLVSSEDADSAASGLSKMRFDAALLDAALDDLDDYGPEIATDIMVDVLIRARQH